MKNRRNLVAILAGITVMVAVALWLTIGANDSLSAAQSACHRQVTATKALPPDTQFRDSEKRATGDVIVVRGDASVRGQPALPYSCTVTKPAGGSYHVEVLLAGH